MQTLSIDGIYPLPINKEEGLTAIFLHKSANVLQLGLRNISPTEINAFKKDSIRCGIYVDQPVILWLFDFGLGGQYDAAFNANLYARKDLDLIDITNDQQRLMIELHVIDLTNNRIKALRGFTLPPELTLNFLSAVQDQLTYNNREVYDKKLSAIYQNPIGTLIEKSKMYLGGS